MSNFHPPNQHLCHWPGCAHKVPPRLWGCKKHWFKLPLKIRTRILTTYVPGQEVTKTPSLAYIESAKAAHHWIAEQSAPAPLQEALPL